MINGRRLGLGSSPSELRPLGSQVIQGEPVLHPIGGRQPRDEWRHERRRDERCTTGRGPSASPTPPTPPQLSPLSLPSLSPCSLQHNAVHCVVRWCSALVHPLVQPFVRWVLL